MLLLVEKILNDWPKYFYAILDDFNRNTNISIEQFHCGNICNIINPIYNISFPVSRNGTLNKEFRKIYSCLFRYFIERFNTAFFKEKLKLFLIEENYITSYVAYKVFKIEHKDLNSYFKTMTVDDEYCVELNDIIELLLKLVKIGVTPWDKTEKGKYEGLTEIVDDWQIYYNFTLYDIIKIVLSLKLA